MKLLRGSMALFVVLAMGCSSMTERVAAWYATRTISSYLDLTSEQKKATRVSVDQTIDELRRSELIRWVSLLREVRQGIHVGMSDQDVARLQNRYDARLDFGVDKLVPRFAPLLVQLDDKQLDHFTGRMREDVDKLYEDRKKPPAEQSAAIEKRALKLVDDFVGDLSDSQEQAIRQLIRAVPNERDQQYRAANDAITHFRAFMDSHPSEPALEAELHSMWDQRYTRLGAGRDKEARRAQQRAWLLSVYKLMTPEQRAHAEEKITERIVSIKRWVIPS